jgi:hypothetical protein
MDNQIEIKVPLRHNAIVFLIFLAFIGSGILMLQAPEPHYRLLGVLFIIVFGILGIVFMFLVREPILILSNEGIKVPVGKILVLWNSVKEIEIILLNASDAKKKYLGVFVFDETEIKGDNMVSQRIIQREANWDKGPALLIDLSHYFFNVERAMETVLGFYSKYKVIT